MKPPSLPRRPEDCWVGGFCVVPPRPVCSVSAGAGLVIAGGDGLHMMRPGAQGVRHRDLPPTIKPVAVVHAEPWAPRRFAAASGQRIFVFEGQAPDEPSTVLAFDDPQYEVTHLAWTRHEEESALYFRTRNGEVGRLWPRRATHEFLDAPPMAAIASDESGVLAMVCLCEDEEDVWVSNEDGSFEARPMTTIPLVSDDADEQTHVYLTVRGAAVAYSVGPSCGVHVSWGRDADFQYCDHLSGGPIAFQNDEALFSAYCVENTASIFRATRDGSTLRIAQIDTDGVADERAWPTITALAWDSSRRTLWAASPQLGLLTSKEPMPKSERLVHN